MHALLQCWFESGFCLFLFLFRSKKKKKIYLIWKMSLFRGLFVFFAMTTKRFFSLNSTDVISETTELGIMFYICSFPVSFLIFFYFPWEQLVLQDLEWCIRGRVVTISDLREVLKAKTEEKGQTERRQGEILSWGVLSCQTTVSRQHKQKKASKKLCPRLYFFWYLT